MADEEKEKEGIYRVDTIPPPDGEDDAYNAPTKVGPMAAAAVKELMQAAERRASELSARNAAKQSAAQLKAAAADLVVPSVPSTPAASKTPPAPNTPSKPPTVPRPLAVPREDATGPVAPITPPASAGDLAPTTSTSSMSVKAVAADASANADADADAAAADAGPPRLYDDNDDGMDAATLLHKSAGPNGPNLPIRREVTALMSAATAPSSAGTAPSSAATASSAPPPVFPSGPSSGSGPAARPLTTSALPRAPIPFDPTSARPPTSPVAPRLLLLPLAIGFLIFAVGLAVYVWAR